MKPKFQACRGLLEIWEQPRQEPHWPRVGASYTSRLPLFLSTALGSRLTPTLRLLDTTAASWSFVRHDRLLSQYIGSAMVPSTVETVKGGGRGGSDSRGIVTSGLRTSTKISPSGFAHVQCSS